MTRFYYWVSGFFLLSAMEAFGFIDRVVYGNWEGKSGDKITQGLNILLILASVVLFHHGYRRKMGGFAVGTILAFSVVGYLFLTAFWSMDPPTTVRIAIVYVFVMFGIIGVARTLEPDEFMHLLSWTCFLSGVASIALLIVSPSNALMSGGYMAGFDFRGTFPHKNFLGQVMATGVLATLHDIRVARRGYVGKFAMLFVLIGVAFASKSTAAWLTTLAFCGITGYFVMWRKGGAARTIGTGLAAVLVPAFAAVMMAPDMILELIGKDPTLTGRTEIWAFVMSDISMRPFLGWGFFGFWQPGNPAAVEIWDAIHWMVPQAHNGLLESLLTIGFVGTGMFIYILVRIFVLACRCLRTPAQALAVSTITCCVGLVLEGVSETILLAPTESLTPVLFIAGLMCERAIWVAKRQRYGMVTPDQAPAPPQVQWGRARETAR
jgi:exopolysaccharide production protein ExoQ